MFFKTIIETVLQAPKMFAKTITYCSSETFQKQNLSLKRVQITNKTHLKRLFTQGVLLTVKDIISCLKTFKSTTRISFGLVCINLLNKLLAKMVLTPKETLS